MLNLFKKKKKEVNQANDDVPLPPAPPAPSKNLADEALSHVPDDHPLDQPLQEKAGLEPKTNLADDHELEAIQKAINQVGEQHSAERLDKPEETLKTPNFDSEDSDNSGETLKNIEEPEDEKKDTYMEGDFVVPDIPEEMAEKIPDSLQEDKEEDLQETSTPVQFTDNDSDEQNPSFEEESSEEDDLPSFEEEPAGPQQGYDLQSLPDTENVSTKPTAPFGIYVDLRDYEKIFKEIRFIDSFSKKCFRTVLKLRDISGNQNKLIDKFHADLAYINERLTFMDSTFFEPKG